MSFGASGGEDAATSAQQRQGVPMLGQGASNLQSGANFFSTLLNGNQANTRALLQPDINRINESTQGALQGASTLMPRGGGRFATLFQQPFAAQQQIGNLFNQARSGAAGGLANIGGTQGQLGTTNAQNLFQNAFGQRQYFNNMIGSTIGALASLAATPMGAGAASGSLFSKIGGGGGAAPFGTYTVEG